MKQTAEEIFKNYGMIVGLGSIECDVMTMTQAMEEYAKEHTRQALEEFRSKNDWRNVTDSNMPKFYENYIICMNGTVQYITYQFVGVEVDEKWIMDDSSPAYWFQAEDGTGGISQILIDEDVFYKELPEPPKK